MGKAQTLISYHNWPRTFSVMLNNFNWIEIFFLFLSVLFALNSKEIVFCSRNFFNAANKRWVVDNCRQHKMRVIHSMIVYRIYQKSAGRKRKGMNIVDRKNENQSETEKQRANEWDRLKQKKKHFYTNMSNVQSGFFFSSFISNGKRYLHRFVSQCFLAVVFLFCQSFFFHLAVQM